MLSMAIMVTNIKEEDKVIGGSVSLNGYKLPTTKILKKHLHILITHNRHEKCGGGGYHIRMALLNYLYY